MGHGGLFPGYTTAVRYYPDYRFAVALQVNTSVSAPLGKSANGELIDLGELVVQGLGLSR